jgi:hypothetical protein
MHVHRAGTLDMLLTCFDRDGVSIALSSVAKYVNKDDKQKEAIWGGGNKPKVKAGHITVLLLQLLLNGALRVREIDNNGVHVKLKLSSKQKTNGDGIKTIELDEAWKGIYVAQLKK